MPKLTPFDTSPGTAYEIAGKLYLVAASGAQPSSSTALADDMPPISSVLVLESVDDASLLRMSWGELATYLVSEDARI
ncbi:MAG: hypothetical protein ACOY5V_18525, partial [Pseudomonadota bacterium]